MNTAKVDRQRGSHQHIQCLFLRNEHKGGGTKDHVLVCVVICSLFSPRHSHSLSFQHRQRLPSYIDGKGSKNHHVQVPGHTTARSGTLPSHLVPDSEAREHHSPSAGGSNERQQQFCPSKPPLDNRHAERTRVRDRLLIQVYNRCHADFSSSLEDLKDFLQQCSIVSSKC